MSRGKTLWEYVRKHLEPGEYQLEGGTSLRVFDDPEAEGVRVWHRLTADRQYEWWLKLRVEETWPIDKWPVVSQGKGNVRTPEQARARAKESFTNPPAVRSNAIPGNRQRDDHDPGTGKRFTSREDFDAYYKRERLIHETPDNIRAEAATKRRHMIDEGIITPQENRPMFVDLPQGGQMPIPKLIKPIPVQNNGGIGASGYTTAFNEMPFPEQPK